MSATTIIAKSAEQCKTNLCVFSEIRELFFEMAPYLVLGLFIAGILYILIPRNKIYSHLSSNGLLPVLKASLLGIPIPLCSCGVIPVAMHLKKSGASNGATLSFLISTPMTGVDSILATYSLLGPLFAIIRPITALIAGIGAGMLISIGKKDSQQKENSAKGEFTCAICDITTPHTHSIKEKIVAMFKYAFFELVKDIGGWILLGVAIGGLISAFVPTAFIKEYLGNPYIAYPLVLVMSIPLYVCATGSIPIAAALISQGMLPGAGLLFLIAGPATNTATITFVGAKLGKKNLIIYLLSIITIGVLSGLLLDALWSGNVSAVGSMSMLPDWIRKGSGILLLALILLSIFKEEEEKMEVKGKDTRVFNVPDMSCKHCTMTIKNSLKDIDGVEDVGFDLGKKLVFVIGRANDTAIKKAIKDAGYTIKDS